MTADALALIDTYTAAMQWAIYAWYASALFLASLAAWAVIAIGRAVFDQIGDSFTRAHQTITDIQQDRKETP